MGDDAGGSERPPIEARYANYFNIGYNAFEVVVECGQSYEGQSGPLWHVRMVTTPAYAKRLLELLKDSLDRYEQTFGVIPRGENG
ncbi:MAG TPA: DUF3467 domain-containing protein [Bryobacteraceae bacterium]|nr:DUF3467 domain-containing protein [Bryobacteraceae bacterium]